MPMQRPSSSRRLASSERVTAPTPRCDAQASSPRPPRRRRAGWALALLLPAIALAACSGGGDDEGGKSVKPAEIVPPSASGCQALHVTPSNGVFSAFVDPLITLTYTAPTAGACNDFTLIGKSLSPVPMRTVSSSERALPQGGVAGHITLMPQEALTTDEPYELRAGGKRIAWFGVGHQRRGSLVDATELPLKLDPDHPQSTLSRAQINDLIDALARRETSNLLERESLKELARVELPHLTSPGARYGAKALKLTYLSADAKGNPVTLSGMLLMPTQDADGSRPNYNGMPMVIGHRGAADNDATDAPSAGNNVLTIPGLMAAGRGHVFFAPDLIGLGDSAKLPQSYLVATDTAAQTQDMLIAVREYFRQHQRAALGRELRITGGSLGGFGAMASLPNLAAEDVTIKQVSVGGGPFDSYRTVDSALRALAGLPRDDYSRYGDLDLVPSHLRRVMDAYQAYQGFSYKPEEVFSADGKKVLPAFLKSYQDGKQNALVAQLNVNSLPGSSQRYDLPDARVQVYHFVRDALIPSQNSADLLAALQQGPNRFASVERGRCHENSELVKLILRISKSPIRTHVICFPFQFDDFIGDLPVEGAAD